MITKEEITKSIVAAWGKAVKDRLALNNKTTWLQADSLEAIVAIADAYYDAMTTIDGDMQGTDNPAASKAEDERLNALRAEAKATFSHWANMLINPSAFRQWLQSDKVGMLPKPDEKKKGSSSGNAALEALGL